jgi:hypothetical protein
VANGRLRAAASERERELVSSQRACRLRVTYRLIAQLEHLADQMGGLAELDAVVSLRVCAEVRPLLGPVLAGPRRRLQLAAAHSELVDWHEQTAGLLLLLRLLLQETGRRRRPGQRQRAAASSCIAGGPPERVVVMVVLRFDLALDGVGGRAASVLFLFI